MKYSQINHTINMFIDYFSIANDIQYIIYSCTNIAYYIILTYITLYYIICYLKDITSYYMIINSIILLYIKYNTFVNILYNFILFIILTIVASLTRYYQ
jgi:hypothetical protein